jgi:hypothetical protein
MTRIALALVPHRRSKTHVPKPCTWDLFPYAYPIGPISSTAHCGPCTAAVVMLAFDHHHHPRLLQTHHGVMHHSCLIVFGHFQSVHPVATPPLARCLGLRSLIFDLLHPHQMTRMQTRKRPRRPCWKRSRVANRQTSCCAVSHCPS